MIRLTRHTRAMKGTQCRGQLVNNVSTGSKTRYVLCSISFLVRIRKRSFRITFRIELGLGLGPGGAAACGSQDFDIGPTHLSLAMAVLSRTNRHNFEGTLSLTAPIQRQRATGAEGNFRSTPQFGCVGFVSFSQSTASQRPWQQVGN